VIWKGQVPYNEIKKYYEHHDVFFMTSLRDSGPSQLIEAMAYGMPVVTLDLHGQGFIVNDKTGIRCNTETPEIAIQELKNAILKLAFDPGLVAQMSAAAFEFASHQNWGEKIDTVVTKYYSLT
jgi:glycosyltransferase involved in cell wall biosynthesis